VDTALCQGSSEDDIKGNFDDKNHDCVDLLAPEPKDNPPQEQGDDILTRSLQDVRDLQYQLYLLEGGVGGAVQQSTQQALNSVAVGLAGLNKLLEFWPEYKGDEPTNEQRLNIIHSAAEQIQHGAKQITEAEGDSSILDKVR
jgi:hypothetical protein